MFDLSVYPACGTRSRVHRTGRTLYHTDGSI